MNTQKQAFQTLRIIHLAMVGSVGIFSAIVAGIVLSHEGGNNPIAVLNYLSPAYFFIMLATYPVVFKAAVKKATSSEITLAEKLRIYQSAHVVRMALLEGSGLFATVVALVNGELLHLIVTAMVIGLMLQKLPSPTLLEEELNLSLSEKNELL